MMAQFISDVLLIILSFATHEYIFLLYSECVFPDYYLFLFANISRLDRITINHRRVHTRDLYHILSRAYEENERILYKKQKNDFSMHLQKYKYVCV